MTHQINLMQKRARAKAVAEYLKAIGQKGCVCFTCGNAGEALAEAGLLVTMVVKPEKWYEFAEIQKRYKLFDATSGHLPAPLMREVAWHLAAELRENPIVLAVIASALKNDMAVNIPTGSGETLVTLKMLYPLLRVMPVYNTDASTMFHPKAPLNALVLALADNHNF
jgi:hypothetical protein